MSATKLELGPTGHAVRANLLRLRTDRGLSTTRPSAALAQYGRPIPVLGLRRIEKGERRVDVDDLTVLAAVLGVTTVRLLATTTNCDACHDSPPPGFICAACQATSEAKGPTP